MLWNHSINPNGKGNRAGREVLKALIERKLSNEVNLKEINLKEIF